MILTSCFVQVGLEEEGGLLGRVPVTLQYHFFPSSIVKSSSIHGSLYLPFKFELSFLTSHLDKFGTLSELPCSGPPE